MPNEAKRQAKANKASIVKQMFERSEFPGLNPEHSNRLVTLANKMSVCRLREGSPGYPVPLCGQVHICPRCNKLAQVRSANNMRDRNRALLHTGCIPLCFRGAIPPEADLLDNLKHLGAVCSAFVMPWSSDQRTKRQSIWADVIAGVRIGVHIDCDKNGNGWYCHAHLVIWLHPSTLLQITLVKSLLRQHWLDCLNAAHLLSTFTDEKPAVDIRRCFSTDCVDFYDKLDSVEASEEYQTKVWEFTDLDKVMQAQETCKISCVKLTRLIGLCHQRSKLPGLLGKNPLCEADADAWMKDRSQPDRRRQCYGTVRCNPIAPPRPLSGHSESWERFRDNNRETRRDRDYERARKRNAAGKNTPNQ